MQLFELPANIKQIGSIGDGLRIYMEDYVCTYLQQYAEAGGYEERLAMLMGRRLVIDGRQVLFINGAVQGKSIQKEGGISVFTEQSMEYADQMREAYFHDSEVVGWMQSQPSYGVYLNAVYAGYHLKVFPEPYQVLFVVDPIEKLNSFYTYNEDKGELAETKGYFIYYEKNKGMQEYMLANKVSNHNSLQMKVAAAQTYRPALMAESTDGPDKPRPEDIPDAARPPEELSPETMIKNRQSVRSLRKVAFEQKRTLNLLVSLSAVLFVICFIMGAGLIQNQDRITELESQIIQLSTAYKNIMVDMRDNTASVFASQPDGAFDTDEQAFLIEEDGGRNLQAGVEEQLLQQNSAAVEQNWQVPANGGMTEQALQTDGMAAGQAPQIPANTAVTEQMPQTDNVAAGQAQQPPANNGAAEQASPASSVTAEQLLQQAGATIEQSPAQQTTSQPDSRATTDSARVIPDTYVVQEGDSLSFISQRFYGTKHMVSRIKELNGMADDIIYYGKVIKLPPLS